MKEFTPRRKRTLQTTYARISQCDLSHAERARVLNVSRAQLYRLIREWQSRLLERTG